MAFHRLLENVRNYGRKSPWLISTVLLVLIIGLSLIFNGGRIIRLNVAMVSVAHDLWGKDSLINSNQILTKYIQQNPEDKNAWRGLGFIRLINGDEDQAVEAWQKAGITPRDLIIKGEFERKNNQFGEAFKWYDLAIKLDPNSGDANFFLGWMYTLDGKLDLAWQYLLKAKELPLDLVTISDLYFQMGKVINQIGIPERGLNAMEYFTLAITKDQFTYPFQAADARFQRALLFRQKGWNELAIDELNYVVKEYPDHYSAWVRLGYMTWEIEENLSKAENYFSEAIKLDDKQIPAYLGFAHALEEAGQGSRAEEMYYKVLEIDPINQAALNALDQLGK